MIVKHATATDGSYEVLLIALDQYEYERIADGTESLEMTNDEMHPRRSIRLAVDENHDNIELAFAEMVREQEAQAK